MPRILHLIQIWGAVTENAWLEYPVGLARRGHEITYGYEQKGPLADACGLPGVRLGRIEVGTTNDTCRQMDELAANPADAALIELSHHGFDIIHGHFGTRILHGAAWLKRGVPMVISLYGYDASRLLGDRAWVDRYRWAARHGATYVVLAQAMGQILQKVGIPESQIICIPLGVVLNRWPFTTRPAPETPVFAFVGRLVEKKGTLDLIDALAWLRDRHGVSASLEIIGDGPMRQALVSRIAKHRLGTRVRLHGAVEREQMVNLLQDITSLVLPSVTAADGDREGTPIVLMEAQAMGIPCMTTNHSGNPEILPPGSARFVVEEHAPRQLCEAMLAMIRLTAGQRRTLQAEGRAWIEKKFNLEETITAYDRLYREILGA